MKRNFILISVFFCGLIFFNFNLGICQPLSFSDDFSSATLDPDWSTRPQWGSISLTDRPGFLRYTHAGVDENYFAANPSLLVYRPFQGSYWVFDTKVQYNMVAGTGKQHFISILFGDISQVYINSVNLWRQSEHGAPCTCDTTLACCCERIMAHFTENGVATELLANQCKFPPPGDIHFWRLERFGRNVIISLSGDGINYTTIGSHTFGSQIDGLPQTLVIYGSAFSNAGSTADYDFVRLTTRLVIDSVTDIAGDQGKQVRIRWKTDVPGDTLVKKYDIFRRIDGAMSASNPLPADWEQVATFSAYGDTLYNGVVPTLIDSTISGGLKYSVFFVRAGTNSPTAFFDSPIDSGYSVDNLAPSPPSNLKTSGAPGAIALRWKPVPDEDFDFFYVYRDTLSGFATAEQIGSTSDTTMIDTLSKLTNAYYYRVTAVDFSGNEGQPSNEVQLCIYKAGDANKSKNLTLPDIILLVNHVFKGAPTPDPKCLGDANNSNTITLPDIIIMVNHIFKGAPEPAKDLDGVCCL